MGTELVPERLRELYYVKEWRHASAVLKGDFPSEWDDVMQVLGEFRLRRSHILEKGKGNKSSISTAIDSALTDKGWREKCFQTKIVVDNNEMESPTHKVDCYKNGVALEIEWNNKDPFYDRDLNNFRLLFDLRTVSVGIIVTRADELQDLFDSLGKGSSYGNSTTHWTKLLPRLEGGGGGGCPILVFAMTTKLYVED